MKNLIKKSILAGLLIGLASIIYMSVIDKVLGSFLFSIGLIAVLILEANLYTGKIGYVNNLNKLKEALIILVFNILSAYLLGLIFKLCIGGEYEVSKRFIDYKWYVVLFKGIGTGMLIYLAVETYKKTKYLIPVILCVMAFILSGFYHCVADATYLGVSPLTFSSVLYLLLVIIGNSIGSLLIRLLQE